jgi:SAM-dependent methyltransferase
MDVGTFIGHDLRRLAYDGAPSEKLIGVDIVGNPFFELGYEFFLDRDHFHGHFIEADFLSSSSSELMALTGQIDIVLVSQLLHQWDWGNQVKALTTLVSFTKPGSLIVGNQIGNAVAQGVAVKQIQSVTTWRHNQQSLIKIFEEVGEATGSQWETQARLRSFADMGWSEKDDAWMEPGVGVIEFVANRLS